MNNLFYVSISVDGDPEQNFDGIMAGYELVRRIPTNIFLLTREPGFTFLQLCTGNTSYSIRKDVYTGYLPA